MLKEPYKLSEKERR